MVTSAMPMGGRFCVPLKMQSAMRSARRDLWLCSPKHPADGVHHVGFAAAVGPTMHVVPVPLNVTTVRSQKRFESYDFDFAQLKQGVPFCRKLLLHARQPHGQPCYCIPTEPGFLRAKRDD